MLSNFGKILSISYMTGIGNWHFLQEGETFWFNNDIVDKNCLTRTINNRSGKYLLFFINSDLEIASI